VIQADRPISGEREVARTKTSEGNGAISVENHQISYFSWSTLAEEEDQLTTGNGVREQRAAKKCHVTCT